MNVCVAKGVQLKTQVMLNKMTQKPLQIYLNISSFIRTQVHEQFECQNLSKEEEPEVVTKKLP